jgi:methyl-accepting chemotaxis protein
VVSRFTGFTNRGQTYRRDLGSTFVAMKGACAPIKVRGRHWGGLRLAYKAQLPDV